MKWQTLELGGGEVRTLGDDGVLLQLPPTHKGYADAQIDDTQGLQRSDFRWQPPLKLSLEARATPETPRGTLGFGFWNDPFSLSLGQSGAARRIPAPPQAVWFFYGSEPHDLQFIPEGGGSGWKAIVIQSPRVPGILALPAAALAAGLAQLPIIRRWVIQVGQRFLQADEIPITVSLKEWHRYEIFWDREAVQFMVDGDRVLTTSISPRAPLGFVAWIDNQYAIFSPSRGLRFGVLPTTQTQSLALRDIEIQTEGTFTTIKKKPQA